MPFQDHKTWQYIIIKNDNVVGFINLFKTPLTAYPLTYIDDNANASTTISDIEYSIRIIIDKKYQIS